jgi:hypothetical protein
LAARPNRLRNRTASPGRLVTIPRQPDEELEVFSEMKKMGLREKFKFLIRVRYLSVVRNEKPNPLLLEILRPVLFSGKPGDGELVYTMSLLRWSANV